MFGRDQFEAPAKALAEALEDIRGGFFLSIDDRPEIRDIVGHFQIEVNCHSSIYGGKGKAVGELVVRGERWREP